MMSDMIDNYILKTACVKRGNHPVWMQRDNAMSYLPPMTVCRCGPVPR